MNECASADHHLLVAMAVHVARTKQRGRKATTARCRSDPKLVAFCGHKNQDELAHKTPAAPGHSRAKALGTLAEAGPTDTREHPILLLAATNAQEHPVLSLRRV